MRTISSLSTIQIHDLENKVEGRPLSYTYSRKGSYRGDPLMKDAYVMSQIIRPTESGPKDIIMPDGTILFDEGPDPWAFCDIFGYRYCHGCLYERNSTPRANFRELKREFKEKHKHECLKSAEKLKLFEIEVLEKAEKEICKSQEDWLIIAKGEYLTKKIIPRVLAFDQDPECFWYALLLLTDYVETKTPKTSCWNSPKEDFKVLMTELNRIKYEPRIFADDSQCQDKKYDLRLCVDGKKISGIHSPSTLYHLSKALFGYSEKMENLEVDEYEYPEEWFDFQNEKAIYRDDMTTPKHEVKDSLFKLYWFHTFLKSYLSRNKDNRSKNCTVSNFIEDSSDSSTGVSVDEELFITDLAKIMFSYINIKDGVLIKDMLKDHKDALSRSERYGGQSKIYDHDIRSFP